MTPKKKIIFGMREAKIMAYRIRTLRKEGFTERELTVLADRRMSSPGMMKLRRARAKELKGLTVDEKREWAIQNEDVRTEETAIEDLRKVSPDFW